MIGVESRNQTNLKRGGIGRRREHGCRHRRNGVYRQGNGAGFYHHNYRET